MQAGTIGSKNSKIPSRRRWIIFRAVDPLPSMMELRKSVWLTSTRLREITLAVKVNCATNRQLFIGKALQRFCMFIYRPPKSSCWGHGIRPKDPQKAKAKANTFFKTYFEGLEADWNTTRQITLSLRWKSSALPNVEWPEDFLKPENQQWQQIIFIITGDRVMFPLGLVIPISLNEPASYEFLGRLSADTPFKMSSKNFQAGILVGKKGNWAWRKPDPNVSAQLHKAID